MTSGWCNRLETAWVKGLVFVATLLSAWTLHAGESPLSANHAELEARMMQIAGELRCLVCQNQTIADSEASLAVDLRQQIRELLSKGRSENEILTFMSERYGDFVLYRPRLSAATWLLWFGPFVLVIAGLIGLFRMLRERRRRAAPATLTDDDHRRIRQLLASEAGSDSA